MASRLSMALQWEANMFKRLTLGVAIALIAAPTLFAAPTLPTQGISHLPWDRLGYAVRNALCEHLNLGCN